MDNPRPAKPYTVTGVDTFDGTSWEAGEFATREEAVAYADAHGGVMLKMHVYDPDGERIHQAGTF